MRTLSITALAGLAMGITLCGCNQETRDQYSAAGQQAGQAVKKDTEIAGKELETAADKAKISADNLLETSKVKSALGSASGLNTRHIDVDTDSKAKTITLSGLVPDQKQKVQAETVAKGIGGSEFKVIDKLIVGQ